MSEKPIGIFDSGIGGLTVLGEIARLLPAENTVYLGDTARVPYGTKSRETVTRYALEIADFLVGTEMKLLVVACNTASAFALEKLREYLSVPVVGVIEPGASMAVDATRNKRIGVIGTEGTIRSGAYFDAIKALDQSVAVYTKPCPLFVPLAEEGWSSNDVTRLTAQKYLADLIEEQVDTLVLGCTHYPVLRAVIEEVMGPEVTIVDSALATTVRVKALLKEADIRNFSGDVYRTYYVTDSPVRFEAVGKNFLQGFDIKAQSVSIL